MRGGVRLLHTGTCHRCRACRLQYFWEAFPAGSGPTDRTTYMFTYMDAAPYRPSLQAVFEDYWKLMPEYQSVALSDLAFKRALFGFFPTFKDTPLRPGWDRCGRWRSGSMATTRTF